MNADAKPGKKTRMRSRKGAPGILEVAARARVSAATVSRFFNNPTVVSPQTRQRIESSARELGYIRDRTAGALHGKMSGSVGLIVPTIDHAIFSELIEAFSSHLHDHDHTMLIASHNYDLQRELSIVRSLLERRIDAIALVGRDHSDAAIDMLKVRDVPTVTLWNAEGTDGIPSIGTDNRRSGFDIANHLIQLKHRHVALLFPDIQYNDRARDRKLGVLDALNHKGIEVPAQWDIRCPYDVVTAKQTAMNLLRLLPAAKHQRANKKDGREKATELLSGNTGQLYDQPIADASVNKQTPSAIICGNDVIAHGVVHAASKLGIAIPEQLSVVGIGDFRGSAAIEPPLTTVRLPARRIGLLAASTLIEKLAGAPKNPMQSAVIDSQLIVRQSTAEAAY